jgi:hypothetical protein
VLQGSHVGEEVHQAGSTRQLALTLLRPSPQAPGGAPESRHGPERCRHMWTKSLQDLTHREVTRLVDHYSLPAIIAVGYRVRSAQGTRFWQWATTRLEEYLVKGFVLDDARLMSAAPPRRRLLESLRTTHIFPRVRIQIGGVQQRPSEATIRNLRIVPWVKVWCGLLRAAARLNPNRLPPPRSRARCYRPTGSTEERGRSPGALHYARSSSTSSIRVATRTRSSQRSRVATSWQLSMR